MFCGFNRRVVRRRGTRSYRIGHDVLAQFDQHPLPKASEARAPLKFLNVQLVEHLVFELRRQLSHELVDVKVALVLIEALLERQNLLAELVRDVLLLHIVPDACHSRSVRVVNLCAQIDGFRHATDKPGLEQYSDPHS